MIYWINFISPIQYLKSIKIMEERVNYIIKNYSYNTIYSFKYQDVYTVGTTYQTKRLDINKFKNIPLYRTGRGGGYTYHGPGQSIIYPLIDLKKEYYKKNIRFYIKNLENIIINTLKNFSINAYTISDQVGIWVNKYNLISKIGDIGIRVKKWITYHGISINISTDLQKYEGIIPCNKLNTSITSLNELGVNISVDNFNSYLKKEFLKIFS